MENIEEEGMEEETVNQPQKMKIKSLEKIQNNRYMNQTIYQLFIQKRYEKCLGVINKCKSDEYKLYMKALIYKN